METFSELSLAQISLFCACTHERARLGNAAAQALMEKLIHSLDEFSAKVAASIYLGFLCAAYFRDGRPLDRPKSDWMQTIFEWQEDMAFSRVLQVFRRKMINSRSAALYYPGGNADKIILVFEHDADQNQSPVVLQQIYYERRGLLEECLETERRLQCILGKDTATVRELGAAICAYYGLPRHLLAFDGADGEDRRLIPESLGFVEFDRFTDAAGAAITAQADAGILGDAEPPPNIDDEDLIVEDED